MMVTRLGFEPKLLEHWMSQKDDSKKDQSETSDNKPADKISWTASPPLQYFQF